MKELIEEIERRYTMLKSERDALSQKTMVLEKEILDERTMSEHWKNEYEKQKKKWKELMQRFERDVDEVSKDDKILNSL